MSYLNTPLRFILAWVVVTLKTVKSSTLHVPQLPNFVLILTDDLDKQMSSSTREYLPNTWQYIADAGTVFQNMAVSMAWCCPSRVSLLSGKLVHNSNITSSRLPNGGAAKFMNEGMDSSYLPTWMQQLGYSTYFTGKFLNSLSLPILENSRCPQGWDVFDAMLDGQNHSYNEWYYYPIFTTNCQGTWMPNGTYHQTDIIRDKGIQYINDAVSKGKPFFIELAPTGPHDQGYGKVAVPCARHANMYLNTSMIMTPNWNVPLPNIMGMKQANSLAFSTSKYIPRLQTLAGVDEMVKAIVEELDALNVLENTYIIFVSDNGFHLGEHGLNYDKFTPYEEDVRVPLFMRGPQIKAGVSTDYQVTMVDLPATILTLAGGNLSSLMDGVPIPFTTLPYYSAQIPTSPPSPPQPPSIHSQPLSNKALSPTPLPQISVLPLARPANPPTPFVWPRQSYMPPKTHPVTAVPSFPSPPIPYLLTPKSHSPPPSPASYDPPLPSINLTHQHKKPRHPSPPGYSKPPVFRALLQEVGKQTTITTMVDGAFANSAHHSASAAREASQAANYSLSRQHKPLLRYLEGSIISRRRQHTTSCSSALPSHTECHRRSLLFETSSGNTPGAFYLRDTIMIEGWLDVNESTFYRKNYRSVRVCSPVFVFGSSSTYQGMTCYKYTVWCIPANAYNILDNLNFFELYDLGLDPYELNNRYRQALLQPLAKSLVERLNAVLTAMAYCQGPSCRNPWRTLHPDGSVNNLLDALSSTHDPFYSQITNFGFKYCSTYYNPINDIADANVVIYGVAANNTLI
ncbi:hypothetical protein CEUSTIGMA_g11593.t1 [Chlamydomonas eustigma]|uniref:Sulfatase N-terminal domain-containing protein n=1 Tax=Chlamydomonas eustigma TaxID=1157962 RepID=A0A250XMY6_9CHLO|nr:hypothetical protein CEUSTIGMA_g11593.t1 [Chlamydomonas eustigma]|eukprot:GAX84170.1 hypothetical protein CEUSTIGMA_g11593.t1 [Chlamydomonas eustigma]